MALTFEDLREIGRAEMVTRRPDIAAVVGDASDMTVSAGAAMADAAVGVAAKGIKATFLDGAQGDDLTTLANDHWGIDRFEAVQAQGSVTFTRTSSGAGITIAAGTRVATQPDASGVAQEFTTDTDLVFLAGQNGPFSVNVTAVLGGKTGNVVAASVTRILTTLADLTFTVTNAAAFVGGAEEESDEDLRERVRDFHKTLRRGTLAALEFGAKQVPTVKRATAVESTTGLVTVYVTDIEGASNAAMVSAVEDELEEWRAAGSLVQVTGGAVFEQAITLTVSVRTGVDTNALAERIREAVSKRVERLKIGETLYRSMIQQAAMNVDPDAITNVTVATPSTDVDPTDSQIIRSPEDVITIS